MIHILITNACIGVRNVNLKLDNASILTAACAMFVFLFFFNGCQHGNMLYRLCSINYFMIIKLSNK